MSDPVGVLRAWPERRGLYAWAVRYKANPRDEEYMRARFGERWPGGRVFPADDVGAESVGHATQVILLYPDATGIGWAPLERRLRRVNPGAELWVTNGRGRSFRLTRATYLRLLAKRLLEQTMLVEAAFSVVFAVVTPVLLLHDLVRGRR